jgi:hypothetical protein
MLISMVALVPKLQFAIGGKADMRSIVGGKGINILTDPAPPRQRKTSAEIDMN